MSLAAALLLLAIIGAAPESTVPLAPPSVHRLVLGSDLVFRGRVQCLDLLEGDDASPTPSASAYRRVLLSITCAVTSRSLRIPDHLVVVLRVPSGALAASLEHLSTTDDRVYFVVRHTDCFGGNSWYEFTEPERPSLSLDALEFLPPDPDLPPAPAMVQPSGAVPPCA